jgi:ABC-type multidrug transport system fused ATPase/permease subunit
VLISPEELKLPSYVKKDVLAAKGGLDGEIAQNGGNLSGGQKQRLTIARALARRPEILILDDSASALDMATDARLRRAIAALDYRPTVFIISQRAASIMQADLILVLDDGKVVGKGMHAELLENCAIYREIYDSQFSGESGETPPSTAAARDNHPARAIDASASRLRETESENSGEVSA